MVPRAASARTVRMEGRHPTPWGRPSRGCRGLSGPLYSSFSPLLADRDPRAFTQAKICGRAPWMIASVRRPCPSDWWFDHIDRGMLADVEAPLRLGVLHQKCCAASNVAL